MKPEDHQHQSATEEKTVTAAAAQCTEDGVCKKPNSPP